VSTQTALIDDRLAKARAARAAQRLAANTVPIAPKGASRYHHKLSSGRRLQVATWQAPEGLFQAIAVGNPELFVGATQGEAFRRLVACHERCGVEDVVSVEVRSNG
jgi:hypothetical protein